MTISDILVLVEASSRAAGLYALSLASLLRAHLTAVAVVLDGPVRPLSGLPGSLLDAMHEESRQSAEQALQEFEQVAKDQAVEAQLVRLDAGRSAEQRLGWLARHFDLTIVQQLPPDQPMNDGLIEAALFGSGRLVILVPQGYTAAAKLDMVLIAWDETAPAARALADALPLLERADRVELVTVMEPRRGSGDQPPERIIELLARHRIKAQFRSLANSGGVAGTLFSQAASIQADLLVMGGYGHSRLRELVLGGTTRTMLMSMTIPTFMAH
jgi:nucleotide-binding universal stress UspA family protein